MTSTESAFFTEEAARETKTNLEGSGEGRGVGVWWVRAVGVALGAMG